MRITYIPKKISIEFAFHCGNTGVSYNTSAKKSIGLGMRDHLFGAASAKFKFVHLSGEFVLGAKCDLCPVVFSYNPGGRLPGDTIMYNMNSKSGRELYS